MVEISEKQLCINIPFSSPEHVSIASEVLKVDKELKGSGVHREITASGLELIVGCVVFRMRKGTPQLLKI